MSTRSLSVAHLVFGVIFLGIAGLWAIATGTDASSADVAALVPLVLIGSGVIGLVAVMVNARSARRAAQRIQQDPYAGVPRPHDAADHTATTLDHEEQK